MVNEGVAPLMGEGLAGAWFPLQDSPTASHRISCKAAHVLRWLQPRELSYFGWKWTESPNRAGQAWDLEWGDGAEAGEEVQPSSFPSMERTLCQHFLPSLGLLWNHCFQQEFILFQPKCNSKKVSLGSSGTQKQAANGWNHPLSLQTNSKKTLGLVSIPRAFYHLNTLL